jgi:hypothetical protein
MAFFKKKNLEKIGIAISSIFLIISIIVFLYIFFRSEIVFEKKYRYIYNKYYLISIASILFSIISFKINTKFKINFFIFIFSIYATSLFIELSFININLSNKNLKNRFDYYLNNIAQDSSLRIFIPPKQFILDSNIPSKKILPLSLARNKNLIVCNENNFWLIQKTDKYGFINADSDWNRDHDIILIGDSYAQGQCVNADQTLKGLFEKNNFKVLNLGIGGTGPLSQYAILKEYVELKKSTVIWFFYEGNDFSDLQKEKSFFQLRKYLEFKDHSQNLKEKNFEINNFLENYHQQTIDILKKEKVLWNDQGIKSFFKLIYLRNFVKNLFFEYFGKKYIEQKDLVYDFEKVYKNFYNHLNKTNNKLIFVYLPEYSRYVAKEGNGARDTLKNKVEDFIHKKYPNTTFVDVDKEVFSNFNNIQKKLFPKGGGHYNSMGYELIANYILQNLNDQKINFKK